MMLNGLIKNLLSQNSPKNPSLQRQTSVVVLQNPISVPSRLHFLHLSLILTISKKGNTHEKGLSKIHSISFIRNVVHLCTDPLSNFLYSCSLFSSAVFVQSFLIFFPSIVVPYILLKLLTVST